MKYFLKIFFSILFISQSAGAELINLYCVDGAKIVAPIGVDTLIDIESDYVVGFNFSENKVEAGMKLAGKSNFLPIYVISYGSDEYGDATLSGIVFGNSRPKGGSATPAFRVKDFKGYCEEQVLFIQKGVMGGFAGKFTANLSLKEDLCFCTTD